MPSWELFSELEPDEQEDILPEDVPTLAVEAGASLGWERWADDVVAIDSFGASAPGATALERFGFSAQNVAERARELLADLDDSLDLELDLDDLDFDDSGDLPRDRGPDRD
jgi:transketolase